MSIIIKDEIANAVVLTIDSNGNMAFGDGTPISRLTRVPRALPPLARHEFDD